MGRWTIGDAQRTAVASVLDDSSWQGLGCLQQVDQLRSQFDIDTRTGLRGCRCFGVELLL
jgi:hypothetical protein